MQTHSTSSLPIELWKQVLTHTSQADRARCSVVSKALQAAAVAAMETVAVSILDQASVESLQSWLDNHGQYIKRLQVSSWPNYATLALVACQHLQQLELAQIKVLVAMGPNSSNSCGPMGGLIALTKLHLCNCTVDGGLVRLSVLTALKTLQVIATSGNSQPCFPGSVFQHYRILTCLELDVVSVTDVHFISCLVSLQKLTDCANSIPNVTRGLLSGGLPTSLRVLELRPTVLDPVVLLGLTNLRELRLVGSGNDFELAGGSAVQLLDAIAAMQQLVELNLWHIRCDWPTASSAAYSSLTASSNLTYLDLEDCRLPVGASKRMLPPAGTLYEFVMFEYEGRSVVLPWQAEDVDRLVMHCPALRSVCLGLQSSMDLDRLTKLSALTGLDARFAGVPIDDGLFEPGASGDFIIDTATMFTGLKQLQLHIAAPVGMATLLPLTALQQLTELEVQGTWTENTDGWEDVYLCSNETPPDVWLELLKMCAGHPGCQAIIVPDLADEQAQLQQQQVQLDEQLQQLQQQQASALSTATAAQDEAAAARAEAAAARAQASAAEAAASAARADAIAARAQASAAEAAANAARADAAELRDQLAALQAAVQHLLRPQATE